MVSAIIPAFNEEKTIRSVLRALKKSPLVDDIIVVDDGSHDHTAEYAKEMGVRVICLPENRGKAFAMEEGVLRARRAVIFFVDADMTGITKEGIEKVIQPVASGNYEMYVALNDRRIFFINKLLRFFPILGGVRALTKELWQSVPRQYKKRFRIETALNYYAKKTKKSMGFELVPNLHNTIKEKKYGILIGLGRRITMTADVVYISIRLYIFENIRLFVKWILRTVKKT